MLKNISGLFPELRFRLSDNVFVLSCFFDNALNSAFYFIGILVNKPRVILPENGAGVVDEKLKRMKSSTPCFLRNRTSGSANTGMPRLSDNLIVNTPKKRSLQTTLAAGGHCIKIHRFFTIKLDNRLHWLSLTVKYKPLMPYRVASFNFVLR